MARIRNRSPKETHKLELIEGVIRMILFSCDSACDTVAYDPVKVEV